MIKLTANDIKKIIKVFSWICKKNVNPIYNRITLSCDAQGNQYVSGRNPDTALFFKISGTAETGNPESVTVDFVPFSNALKTTRQDYMVLATEGLAKFASVDCSLAFNLDTKDEHVVIKGSLRNDDSKPFSTVASSDLLKALSTVSYALSTSKCMDSLKGFHLNNYSGKLNIFATDTHRLAVAVVDGDTP